MLITFIRITSRMWVVGKLPLQFLDGDSGNQFVFVFLSDLWQLFYLDWVDMCLFVGFFYCCFLPILWVVFFFFSVFI